MTFDVDDNGFSSQRSAVKESEVWVVPQSRLQERAVNEIVSIKNEKKEKRHRDKDTLLIKTQVSNMIGTYRQKLEQSKDEFSKAVVETHNLSNSS